MKKIFIFTLFAAVLSATQAFAQQSCDCFQVYVVAPDNDNSCCYNVVIERIDSTCNQNTYNQVNIQLMLTPSDGEIYDFFPATGYTGSISGQNISVFSSHNLANVAGPQVIGQLCAGSAIFFLPFQFTLTGTPTPPPCGQFYGVDHGCYNNYYPEFAQVCGDSAANQPTKIKAFGGMVYVAGVRIFNGLNLATFSQYSNSGTLNWTIESDRPAIFHDFVANETNDAFFLVGATEPFQSNGIPQNNASLLYKVDVNGNVLINRIYGETGREHFNRIIRHPNSLNQATPYYIVGTKNPATNPPPPSATDVVFMISMQEDGTVGCYREFDMAGPDDEEFHRGLFPLSDGRIVLTGNETIANDGVIVVASSLDCSVLNAYRYPAVLDIYDGIESPGGDMLIVGADFGNSRPFVAKLNPDFTVNSAFRMQNSLDFREIGLDRFDRIYAIGTEKTGLKRNIMYRFRSVTSGFPLQYDNFAYYLDQGETAFTQGRLFVSPFIDNIFYADSRKDNPSGFGNFDLMVGSFNLSMQSNCLEEFPDFAGSFNFNRVPVTVSSIADSLPAHSPLPTHQIFYDCNTFCSNQDTCTANFTWQPTGNCFEVNLQASGTGAPPLSYQWSFGATSQSTFIALPCPGSPVLVCLTVTDATGCSAVYCETVLAPPDMVAPVITCAMGGNVNTDPGFCGANLNLSATAVDNCDAAPSINYQIINDIGGTNPNTFYPLGQSFLIATATDCSGNTSFCTTTVFIVDNQPPTIICPPGKSVNTQICFNGANVDFNPPVATDNCPNLVYTCSHQSGDFFPCGTTLVTCTATDSAGLTGTCSFPITVNCSCGSIAGAFMECTEDPYIYQFTIQVQDQSGASSCNLTLNGPSGMSNVVINPFIAGVAEITGELSVTDPIPANFSFSVTMNCICPSGLPITCDLPLQISTVCCKKIAVEDQVVCADAATFDVDIVIPTTGTLNNISRVKWYIQNKPTSGVCPSAPWGGVPYQDAISSTLTTLNLYPEYLTGDICYYAVVSLNDGPCTEITSNIACINLCEPTVCTIPDQQFCYTGAPIVPNLMTLTFDPNDSACIQSWFWVDPNDQSVQTGGDNYQPTQLLSSSNPTVDCFEDFVYTVVLNDECGQHFCTSTVRLWNDAAPKGTLVIDPFESPQPFCPGEDLTLAFEPDCIQPSEEWTWLISLDGLNYNPLPGAGTSNPLWHTNQLYQDTWYAVETTNGMCDPHQVGLFIDILPELQLVSFDAEYDNPCNPDGVMMTVEFTPGSSADCAYTIEWYKDGVSVSSTTFAGTLETYTYVPPVGEGVAGNYYCTIKDCCDNIIKSNVVKIEPPCFAVVAGPCFICNQDTTTLTGLIVNMPVGSSCTYEWTAMDGGHIIGSTTGDQIQVSTNGIYAFKATCIDVNGNSCIKTAEFDLLECFNDAVNCGNVSTMDFYASLDIAFALQPNPTSGLLNLAFENFTTQSYQVNILDAQGKVLHQKTVASGVKMVQLDLNLLPAGAYFLRLTDASGRSGARLFVKE